MNIIIWFFEKNIQISPITLLTLIISVIAISITMTVMCFIG